MSFDRILYILRLLTVTCTFWSIDIDRIILISYNFAVTKMFYLFGLLYCDARQKLPIYAIRTVKFSSSDPEEVMCCTPDT